MANMRKCKGNSFQNKCESEEGSAVREFLSKIGDKWSIVLILILADQPKQRARFSELKRQAAGISQAMLTSTLRGLEEDGLVTREIFPEVPPRVEYQLTKLGEGLLEPMQMLADWVVDNWSTIKRARTNFKK
jgi:DNA-binding HxlR family transcriptional regulator